MQRTARLKINCLISDRYYSNNKLTSEPLIFKGCSSKCENQTGSFGAAARVKVCQLDGGRHFGSENYKKPLIEFIEEDLCVTAAMKYIDSLHSTVCVLTPNSDSAENSLSFEAICGGNAIIIS